MVRIIWDILLTILVFIFIFIAFFSACSKVSGAEATVREFFNACEAKDVERMTSCFTSDMLDKPTAWFVIRVAEGSEKFEVIRLKTSIVDSEWLEIEDGEDAIVEASYTYRITTRDGQNTYSETHEIYLIKGEITNNEWLIADTK